MDAKWHLIISFSCFYVQFMIFGTYSVFFSVPCMTPVIFNTSMAISLWFPFLLSMPFSVTMIQSELNDNNNNKKIIIKIISAYSIMPQMYIMHWPWLLKSSIFVEYMKKHKMFHLFPTVQQVLLVKVFGWMFANVAIFNMVNIPLFWTILIQYLAQFFFSGIWSFNRRYYTSIEIFLYIKFCLNKKLYLNLI